MTRYSVIPGAVDQFNRMINFAVWQADAGPVAICATEADANKVAAALNEFDPVLDEPPPAPDPEYGLCPRGGDHATGEGWLCKKCGEDTCPI